MSSEFTALVEKIRGTDVSCFNTYLFLFEKLCGTLFCAKEQTIAAIGQPVYDAIETISEATRFNYGDIYCELHDMQESDQNVDKMKDWLNKIDIARAGATTQIAILQRVLDNKAAALEAIQQTDSFKAARNRLNVEINAFDEIALARSDRIRGRHVCMLVSDGEILSTKAGYDLFLNRSVHRVKPAIVGLDQNIFKFPNRYGAYTYAVFEDQERAVSYRKAIADLFGEPVDTQ